MIATPPSVPAVCRLLRFAILVCTTAGICTVNKPSIDNAMATNSAAKPVTIQGCSKAAAGACPPSAAKAVPAIV